MSLERLWAGWRTEYVSGTGAASEEKDGCVFCRILGSGQPDEETLVLWRGEHTAAILNAYPYTSGHLMVLPRRHVADLHELGPEEALELWSGTTAGAGALRRAYRPEGINLGANIGRAAGAGIPDHFHLHLVPRWVGDTNFMTSVAEVRILPEALPASWERLREAWSNAEDDRG